jgi:hypothetical protein
MQISKEIKRTILNPHRTKTIWTRHVMTNLRLLFALLFFLNCGFPANRNWIDDLFSTSSLQKLLQLRENQFTSIEAINSKYWLNQKQLLKMRSLHNQEIQKASWEKIVDLGRMEQLLQDSAKIEVELQMLAIKRRISIEKTLSADQMIKLRTLVRNNLIIENKGNNAIQ